MVKILKRFLSPLTLTIPLLFPLPTLALPSISGELPKLCAQHTANQFNVPLEDIQIPSQSSSSTNGIPDPEITVVWQIPDYGSASGICDFNKQQELVRYRVSRPPKTNPPPNKKRFNGLPGYGDVMVNRGRAAVQAFDNRPSSSSKQSFLVTSLRTGRTGKWYALCNKSSDQVYNEKGKYVGKDRRLTVMFSYVCEISHYRR